MKWFHHDCAASSDPKLQFLGTAHGLEGIGLFWILLEEIGQHSDTFHLKLIGSSKECDRNFFNLLTNRESPHDHLLGSHLDPTKIPQLQVRTLAKHHFTSTKKLMAVIRSCTNIGLFDHQKWIRFNVLYSPKFEQRADEYTRRVQRKGQSVRTGSEQTPDNVRTLSGQYPDTLRTKFGKVPLETEAEQIQKKRERTEKDLFVKDAKRKNEISTSCQQGFIELSEGQFHEYSSLFRSEISSWNDGRTNKFDWNPTEPELRKLFFGGEPELKERSYFSAYNLLGENVHYAELVLRAVRLMLRSSGKSRITNPFGWMWSCLHGNGDGTLPWVQLLTAEEENTVGALMRRRSPSDHAP